MSSSHSSLVLLKRQVSLGLDLLIERETEKEQEIEVVRELKESLSSWEGLGLYFQDIDSAMLTEELRNLRQRAIHDESEALKITQLLEERSSNRLSRTRKKGEELAVRLLEYYPRVIRRKEALLSKSRWKKKIVQRLLKDDTFERLSHSTDLQDEAFLLEEVLKELVKKMEKESPGKVWKMCSLLQEVEWGTHSVTTMDIDGCDGLYDFLMSIFERAEGYDFYTKRWTGHRNQSVDEAESTIEELASKARLALIKLLEEWERDHKPRGGKGGRR